MSFTWKKQTLFGFWNSCRGWVRWGLGSVPWDFGVNGGKKAEWWNAVWFSSKSIRILLCFRIELDNPFNIFLIVVTTGCWLVKVSQKEEEEEEEDGVEPPRHILGRSDEIDKRVRRYTDSDIWVSVLRSPCLLGSD